MPNRKKTGWLAYVVVGLMVSVLAFHFYPRSLERAMGLDDVSAGDISHLSVMWDTYEQPDETQPLERKSFAEQDITDEAVIRDVLSLLAGQRMRRTVARGPYYFPADPAKPAHIELSITLEGAERSTRVSILDKSMVMINATPYVLYGDGIPTLDLVDSMRDLEDTD